MKNAKRVKEMSLKGWQPSEGFDRQGVYTISNAGGYYIELSRDNESARLQLTQEDGDWMSDWFEIEYVRDEDAESDEDEYVPIIDPKGFNVPLSLCLCT